MRKISLLITLSVMLVVILASTVFAAVPLPSKYHPENAPTITGEKPTGTALAETDTNEARILFTQKIVNVILGIAGIVAIYFILTNGLYLAASGGSEEVVTQRKKGLMWAIVGLLLIILSYSILRFIIMIPFSADEEPAPATTSAPASDWDSPPASGFGAPPPDNSWANPPAASEQSRATQPPAAAEGGRGGVGAGAVPIAN